MNLVIWACHQPEFPTDFAEGIPKFPEIFEKYHTHPSSKCISMAELTTEFRVWIPKHQPLPVRTWKIKEDIVLGSWEEDQIMNYSCSYSPCVGALLLSFCSFRFTLAARWKDQKDFSLWAADLSEDTELHERLALAWALAPWLLFASRGCLFNLAALYLQDEPKVRSKSFALGPDSYRWLSVGGIWVRFLA